MRFLFIWLMLPACALAGAYSFDDLSTPPLERMFTGRPGPWGQLQYTRIAIGIPEEYLETVTTGTFATGTWVFIGHSPQDVAQVFSRAALTPAQRHYLVNQAKWQQGPGATVVFPSSELILGMNREARATIYAVLGKFPENPSQAGPYMFRPHFLADHFHESGVTSETITRFEKLLYPKGDILMFADLDPFLSSIPTAEEKRKFHLAISRRLTYLVRLQFQQNADTEQLLNYWDFSGRYKALRPLFESLSRLDVERRIDLAHVLPGFARKRIYTYPPPDDSNPVDHNCHWSAFNFFNDPPDERFCESRFIQESALQAYDQVTTEPQFGDIVVLFSRNGSAVHSAVWIADDLVFTKNGSGHVEPWLYMHLQDMLDFYNTSLPAGESLQVRLIRKKGASAGKRRD